MGKESASEMMSISSKVSKVKTTKNIRINLTMMKDNQGRGVLAQKLVDRQAKSNSVMRGGSRGVGGESSAAPGVLRLQESNSIISSLNMQKNLNKNKFGKHDKGLGDIPKSSAADLNQIQREPQPAPAKNFQISGQNFQPRKNNPQMEQIFTMQNDFQQSQK